MAASASLPSSVSPGCGAAPTGVIDFTVPVELQDLLARIRSYIAEDVLPAEQEIADPTDVLASWAVVEGLRDRARQRACTPPTCPSSGVGWESGCWA